MGQSLHSVVCVETPDSHPQIFMYQYGDLEVHDNVVFEANTAVDYGGAVSLQINSSFRPSGVGCFGYVLRGLV